MNSFSYSHSPKLEVNLHTIDQLRSDILCIVLSGQTEQYLRWEALVNRIYSLLNGPAPTITKQEIIEILSHPRRRAESIREEVVTAYKSLFDIIMGKWLVTSAPIDESVIAFFAQQIKAGSIRSASSEDLAHLCSYLHQSSEQPVIAAGIAYIQIQRLSPVSAYHDWLAWITAYLFLYRGGYNLKDLLVLEGNVAGEKEWNDQVEEAKHRDNLTLWLEYWTDCLVREMRRIQQVLATAYQDALSGTPEFLWELTDRQKEILVMLDQPGGRMTNRKVQKGWNVSQITASRDLALLAGYGLIYVHGKGRSVYYTRV